MLSPIPFTNFNNPMYNLSLRALLEEKNEDIARIKE